LASVYLGAVLFGGVAGVYDFLAAAHSASPARILEILLAVLWGTTLTGFVLLLWPLAYFTHWILERQLDR
jgi:hypothetical protein